VHASSPPNLASVHVQKFGKRKWFVIEPQILNAVGFIPCPKFRIESTLNASTFITASELELEFEGLASSDVTEKHVKSSPHLNVSGHEYRASMHRTALGKGEHAYTNPAPVALLIHVCDDVQKMPLPQSVLSRFGNGNAATIPNNGIRYAKTVNETMILIMLYSIFYYI
jgi:hypothetical protein